MSVDSAPNDGVWWWQDRWFRVDPTPCEGAEHCRSCGRLMVETVESQGYASNGRPEYHRWHSCPRYLVPTWKAILPGYGMGHDSHDADEPMLTRRWA